MPIIGKLVGAYLMSQSGNRQFPNISPLFPGMAAILGLTIVIAFFIMVVEISVLYLFYQALVAYGFSTLAALGLTNLLVLVAIFLMVQFVKHMIHRVKVTLLSCLEAQAPIATRLTHVGHSFLRGLSLKAKSKLQPSGRC